MSSIKSSRRPPESSCPGGSEYVWPSGVEGVKGRFTGGRSLPYFPKKEKRICGVQKNATPTIFEIELANLNHSFP